MIGQPTLTAPIGPSGPGPVAPIGPGRMTPSGPGRMTPSGLGRVAKIVVGGGFGAGKTTFVSTASDIEAVTAEVAMTSPGAACDAMSPLAGKTATTAGIDFGRVRVEGWPALYLFGTPGQRRFWPMWHAAADGAAGAVVLVDPRRLGDCFAPIDFFEQRGLPFVVAVNRFDAAPVYPLPVLRDALALDADVPVLSCDARRRPDVTTALTALLEHAQTTRRATTGLSI